MYEIFKESMNSRIQAAGYLGMALTLVSIYYFELVIKDIEVTKDELQKIDSIRNILLISNDIEEINRLLVESDFLSSKIKKTVMGCYTGLTVI